MENKEFKLDIPERFYSDAEGKPFENCNVCGKSLLVEGTSYVVEKAMKNYEGYDFSSTVYEFAICTSCHGQVQQGMSKESLANLQSYYAKFMEERQGQPIFIDMRNFNLDNWLSKCFFKGEAIQDMKEYQIVAQFNGDKMMMNTPPMIIGEAAMDEMSALMSDKTIDEMNGFKERFLGPPPEIEELIYGKRLIMI